MSQNQKDKENLIFSTLFDWYNDREPNVFVPEKSYIRVAQPNNPYTDYQFLIQAVLENHWTEENHFTRQAQDLLSDITGQGYISFCNSGSSADLLAFEALSERYKIDTVLTTAVNFPSTVFPAIRGNKKIIFVDTDPETLAPDYKQLEDYVQNHQHANIMVILAHTLGFPFSEEEVLNACLGSNCCFLFDCCFVAGTQIKTSEGDKNIEDIKVGDLVLTRFGYKKVTASGMTGYKEVITRFGLTGTPNHPIITTKGIKTLDTLSVSDILYGWNQKKSSITEQHITDTQSLKIDHLGFIFGSIQKIKNSCLSTNKFGLTIMEKSLKDFKYTIKMKILSIMTFPIWNFLLQVNTPEGILRSSYYPNIMKIWNWQERKLQNGMEVKKGWSGIRSMENCVGKIGQRIQPLANFVEKHIKHIFLRDQNIVQENALNIVDLENLPVYNLCVEECHEFFANGILVHNCDSLSAQIDGFPVGHFSDLSTYSFYPAHHVNSVQGGAICSNSKEMTTIIDSYRNWGRSCYCPPNEDNTCGQIFSGKWGELPRGYSHKYVTARIGYNLQFSELQAALLCSQLPMHETIRDGRRMNFNTLRIGLTDLEDYFDFVKIDAGAIPSPFGFPILCKPPINRLKLIRYLEDHKIGTRLIFGGNLSLQPGFIPYVKSGQIQCPFDLSGANLITNDMLWISCNQNLSRPQMDYMIETLHQAVKEIK